MSEKTTPAILYNVFRSGLGGLWPAAIALSLLGALWLTFGSAMPVAAGGPWYVNAATGDDANDCLSPTSACATVQGAFDKAASGDTIHIAPGVYPTNLSYSSKDVIYVGAGPDETILDGGGTDRVLRAYSADTVLSGMTIRNGYTNDAFGGGIEAVGSLLMSDVVLRNNVAEEQWGGGLWAEGNITLTNVLATHNTADYGSGVYLNFWLNGNVEEDDVVLENVAVVENDTTGGGGALNLRGVDARITNTTVSGNTGIGIYTSNFAHITMTHTTIAANSGLGLNYYNGAAWVQNSIIAGNNGDSNECNVPFWMYSWGGNVENGDSCDFDHASDQVNVDPLLELLANNGGETLTHALAPGSPALDAALETGCAATDQRGLARPQEGDGTPPAECDSGAFEYAEIGVTAVAINAPATANVNSNVTLEAIISPDTATQPVTYTWTADGQTAVTHSSGLTDSVTFTWDSAGAKTVNVTADNGLAQSDDSIQITLEAGTQAVSDVTITGPATGNAAETITFTAGVAPADATLPVTYTWQIDGQAPVTHVGGTNHQLALTWPDAGSYTLTVTAINPAGSASDSHTVALTAWYVDAVNGDDANNCQTPAAACRTIQSTLQRAPAGATLKLAPGVYSETVTITQPANLIGAGAAQTILTAGGGPVVTVNDGEPGKFEAHLEGMTIQDGAEEGIFNEEDLLVSDSVIQDNGGRGISNYASLAMRQSVIRGNTASNGAALSNSGVADLSAVAIHDNVSEETILYTSGFGNTSLTNVTVSGNDTGQGTGSAVSGGHDATVSILNSTIVNNSGGGLSDYGALMTLQNTILANNDGDNCWTAVTSLGNNLEDDDTCALDGSGDLANTDPLLEPLADNGGASLTHLPTPHSPAIDAADNAACPAADQRGTVRPLDGDDDGTAVCDVGAVEVDLLNVVFLPAVVR